MVTAGVYMVCRLSPLFVLSETAMLVVASIGAATAFMGATIALVQTDIKRVLAYSTISQLGYMFLACGVGAFGIAVFHLFTHAFFKALLFLGSGSVIHALSGEQDMRRMGGLRKHIPWTFATFLVGTLAIAGIWPLAGFFSKDAILASALGKHGNIFFVVGLVTALLTAFYMARLLFLTFFGKYWGAEPHIHESPPSMLGPLVILAVGSAVGGFVNIPHFVEPVFRLPVHEEGHPGWLPWVASFTAVAGIAAAYYLYLVYTELPARLALLRGRVPRARAQVRLRRPLRLDRRRAWSRGAATCCGRARRRVIDGAVNGRGALSAAGPPARRCRPASCAATRC
jgi:NADH-quinone oxidoreductase subunit L